MKLDDIVKLMGLALDEVLRATGYIRGRQWSRWASALYCTLKIGDKEIECSSWGEPQLVLYEHPVYSYYGQFITHSPLPALPSYCDLKITAKHLDFNELDNLDLFQRNSSDKIRLTVWNERGEPIKQWKIRGFVRDLKTTYSDMDMDTVSADITISIVDSKQTIGEEKTITYY
jgi:hypothetical protein